jgi:hypothetical protein
MVNMAGTQAMVAHAPHLTWGVVVSQNVRRIFQQVSRVLLECCTIIGRPFYCFSIASSFAGFIERCSAKIVAKRVLRPGSDFVGLLAYDCFQNWMQFLPRLGS